VEGYDCSCGTESVNSFFNLLVAGGFHDGEG